MTIAPLTCDLLEVTFAGEWDPDSAEKLCWVREWGAVGGYRREEPPRAPGHFPGEGGQDWGCPGIAVTQLSSEAIQDLPSCPCAERAARALGAGMLPP